MTSSTTKNGTKGILVPRRPRHVPFERRIDRAADRWAQVISLAILGAVAFEAILPVAWSYWKSVAWPYSAGFLAVAVWLSSVALLAIVCEPMRIARRQWSRLLWYPHLWVAVVVAVALASVAERLPLSLRPQSTGPDWQHVYPLVIVGLALLSALGLSNLKRGETRAFLVDDAEPRRIAWPLVETWIRSGEEPISKEAFDLFRHRSLATRVAALIEQGRPVALLGQFGIGKTSILNLVRDKLAKSETTTIIATLNAWAVARPEDVTASRSSAHLIGARCLRRHHSVPIVARIVPTSCFGGADGTSGESAGRPKPRRAPGRA